MQPVQLSNRKFNRNRFPFSSKTFPTEKKRKKEKKKKVLRKREAREDKTTDVTESLTLAIRSFFPYNCHVSQREPIPINIPPNLPFTIFFSKQKSPCCSAPFAKPKWCSSFQLSCSSPRHERPGGSPLLLLSEARHFAAQKSSRLRFHTPDPVPVPVSVPPVRTTRRFQCRFEEESLESVGRCEAEALRGPRLGPEIIGEVRG